MLPRHPSPLKNNTSRHQGSSVPKVEKAQASIVVGCARRNSAPVGPDSLGSRHARLAITGVDVLRYAAHVVGVVGAVDEVGGRLGDPLHAAS